MPIFMCRYALFLQAQSHMLNNVNGKVDCSIRVFCYRYIWQMTSQHIIPYMGKLVNLANREIFAKLFHIRYIKMCLAYALTLAYQPN